MISVFITNLGKYVEGELYGEWLKLPTLKPNLQDLFSRIGIDGITYEEFFITDYDTEIEGLHNFGEYENIDELNYLAVQLFNMDKYELEVFTAAVEHGEHTRSVKELINLTDNLDCYLYYPNIENEDDLGRYYIDELFSLEVPEYLQNYIDYEAYGRDIYLEENGSFVSGGYVVNTGDSFMEYYGGQDDIPEEYCIFSYPESEDKTVVLGKKILP